MGRVHRLRKTLRRLRERSAAFLATDHARYRDDPVGYCCDILRVQLTPQQEDLARLLRTPPYRVLAPSGHNVGKSFLAACLVNWWYDVHDPGLVLTTAPTDRQVRRILWKEVRLVRGRRGGFPGPKAPRLESGPGHFAEGFTARESTRFQGHHGPAVLIVFDEAEGVDQEFWEAAESMLGGSHYAFLGTYNPTSQSAPTVEAERSGQYHVRRLSAVDHPNIAAELRGEPPPYHSAIRLARLVEMLAKWSQEIDPREAEPDDVVLAGPAFPVRAFRPGPIAQARLLGRRPSQGFDSVWSEWAFDSACARVLPLVGPLQIGCDVARYGDDCTSFHVRVGGVSLYHESVNGWSTVRTAERCKWLATEYGQQRNLRPQDVTIAVDDCGVGGGVTDILHESGWRAAGVNTGAESPAPDEYPNLRSALWFGLADEAAAGNVSFARLRQDQQAELRRQFLAPVYTMDVRGRRCVESKDDTKDRIKRSPDDADGVLLAYAAVRAIPDRVGGRVRVPE